MTLPQIDILANGLGTAYSGGTATVYYAGTTTLAAIYSDAAGTTLATNPVTLNANGSAVAYSNRRLKVDVKNTLSVSAPGFPIDNIGYGIIAPDGYIADSYASLSAAVTAIGSEQTTLYVPTGTYTVSADLTIPSTLKLEVYNGAVLSINSGKILTINGSFEAGLYQVFSGSGTVVFSSGTVTEVYPEWWGAVADGVIVSGTKTVGAISDIPTIASISGTDNGIAINAAITSVKSNPVPVILSTGDYKSTITIKVFDGTVLKGASESARIVFDANVDGIQNGTAPFARISNVNLNGFTVQAVESKGDKGINANGIVYSNIDNVTIKNFHSYGIYVDDTSASYLTINECIVYANNGQGVHLAGDPSQPNAVRILNSVISANNDHGIGIGASVQSARVENCSIESNNGSGIYLAGRGCTILGNHLEANASYGIYVLDAVGTGYVTNNFGAGNYFYGNVLHATNFSGTEDAIGWFYGGQLANMTWQSHSVTTPVLNMTNGSIINVGRVAINDSSDTDTRIQSTSSSANHVVSFLQSGGTLTRIACSNAKMTGLVTYADNAAATAGGLVAGDFYRTSTGQLMVRY